MQPHSTQLGVCFTESARWKLEFNTEIQCGARLSSPACMLRRFSRVRLCAALWTAALQAPLCTGFSRQECWSGLPHPLKYRVSMRPGQ